MRSLLIRSSLASVLFVSAALAGRIVLTDGTVYEGTIKKMGTSYSVRLDDGTMKLVGASDVKTIDDPTLAPAATPGGPDKAATSPNTGADFEHTARQADTVDSPLFAVTLWQKYIDTHPGAADLPQAQKELAKWQDWSKEGAERVKGKWVVGDDLKTLHEQVDDMTRTAEELMTSDQTLKGVAKLQEILAIYPNSFTANFEMGYYYLVKITSVAGSDDLIDNSIKSLELAVKLKPNSAAALSNLAIAYNWRHRYEDAVLMADKAARIEDSQDIVQNLVNALSYAPPAMRETNPKVRPIVEEAHILASRHNIGGPSGRWIYVRPTEKTRRGGEDDDDDTDAMARRGIVGSGTGFFISSDGYLLTNRHVAAAGDKMIVRLADGTQKVAEKVVVDDDQDIAVLKITEDKPLPYIKLAAYDEPPIGTDVTVMGFPLGGMLGMNVKITRGVVTSIEEGKQECDVIVDAQVNPGNSGGPMLDKYGNLMAMTSMKTLSDKEVGSYGLGISTSRLRKFFDHQKEKLTAIHLSAGDKGTTALSTEDIAQKFTSATVMILIVKGELPEGLK